MKKQRIFTVYLNASKGKAQDLDVVTTQLNNSGWSVVQISSAFGNRDVTGCHQFPTLAVTILAEKEE